MKKFLLAMLALVILAVALIGLPSIIYLSRNPAISVANYQRHYFARKLWSADFRTIVSAVRFVWEVSHPPKLITAMVATNNLPVLPPISSTNPVAMEMAPRRVASSVAGGSVAPPLSVVSYARRESSGAPGRTSSATFNHSVSRGNGARSSGVHGFGTTRHNASRVNSAQSHARAAAENLKNAVSA